MHFSKIPNHEQEFINTGKGLQDKMFTLKRFSVQVPNETLTMNAISCRPANGDASFYYDETHPKKKVILHFTAGYLKSDIFYLTQKDNKVSVAFTIARDGTIYNLFSSAKWSYHLGKDAVGGNGTNSKNSIGIELCNIGPLKRVGDNLATVYADTDIYCSINDKDQYIETEQEFRGYKYFATHTDAQYKSLAILLRYLTAQYNIPRAFLDESKRYLTNEEVAAFNGIVTHINFRVDGKWDIGPGFDWSRLIADVTGDGAALAPEVATRGAVKTMTEEEVEARVEKIADTAAVYYGEDGPSEQHPRM
jgi:N-acetyl-anhydromuramyl-L-alanine amidase AmpD